MQLFDNVVATRTYFLKEVRLYGFYRKNNSVMFQKTDKYIQ